MRACVIPGFIELTVSGFSSGSGNPNTQRTSDYRPYRAMRSANLQGQHHDPRTYQAIIVEIRLLQPLASSSPPHLTLKLPALSVSLAGLFSKRPCYLVIFILRRGLHAVRNLSLPMSPSCSASCRAMGHGYSMISIHSIHCFFGFLAFVTNDLGSGPCPGLCGTTPTRAFSCVEASLHGNAFIFVSSLIPVFFLYFMSFAVS